MGTEGGKLFATDGRRLAHVEEFKNGRGTTVAVDNPKYVQRLPFGVQTTGNVWRRTLFKAAHVSPLARGSALVAGVEKGVIAIGEKETEKPIHEDAYGLRGASWHAFQDYALASIRLNLRPAGRSDIIGFSPVALRRGSVVRMR